MFDKRTGKKNCGKVAKELARTVAKNWQEELWQTYIESVTNRSLMFTIQFIKLCCALVNQLEMVGYIFIFCIECCALVTLLKT